LQAEEQAAKIALKQRFPLMLFMFPTLLAVLVGPSAIQVARPLLPTMTAMPGGEAIERTAFTGEFHVCVGPVS
jgi:tight adherence protein C